jgi:hypothetical protein
MHKEKLTSTICEHMQKQFESGNLNNNNLVQIIEHIGGLLNLQTISDYAVENSMSYNGVKKFRNVINLFGAKFVIDNL